MRARYPRLVLAAAVAVSLVLVGETAAHADDPPNGPFFPGGNRRTTVITRVSAGPEGVTIFIQVRDTHPGGAAGPSSAAQPTGAGARTPNCSATPALIGNASVAWAVAGAAANPGRTPYAVYCDGGLVGIVWLPASTEPGSVRIVIEPGGAVDPRELAQSLLERIPLPPIAIGVNPLVGLVALASWFWVDGYDGAPIRMVASLGGVTVEVELTAQRYHWQFGDGAEVTSAASLGRRYPEPSDLRHTYEQSSLRAGGAYRLGLEVT